MRTEYRVDDNVEVGVEEEVGNVGQPQQQQQGGANGLGFEPPLGMIVGSMSGANLIAQGIQEIIGSRIYETWLLKNVHRVDATSAMRMIDTTQVSDGGNPAVYTKTTTPMKLRVPYGINEDPSRTVAEDATYSETSATFGLYNPPIVTFRTKQTISNELLTDAKIQEILGFQFAENIAERLQEYLLYQIGQSVVASATRHNKNPTGGNVGTTDGIPKLAVLEAMCSASPIAASWATTIRGGVGVETALFRQVERHQLMIASHPAAASTFLMNTTSGVEQSSHSIVSAVSNYPGCVSTILGLPWYTDESMPLPSVAGSTAGLTTPHILIFNPLQVLLAIKSPVRVTLDTESGMASNQTTVHATFRAAGSMLNPRSVAAYSLKTLIA